VRGEYCLRRGGMLSKRSPISVSGVCFRPREGRVLSKTYMTPIDLDSLEIIEVSVPVRGEYCLRPYGLETITIFSFQGAVAPMYLIHECNLDIKYNLKKH
jgi:hypothetical protein